MSKKVLFRRHSDYLGVKERCSSSPSRAKDLQVVRVVHYAQDVTEGVDHGSGDEPLPAVREDLVLFRSHGQQPLEGRRHVVDVPVQDGAAGLVVPAPGAYRRSIRLNSCS